VTLFVTTRHDLPTATATNHIPDLQGTWTLESAGSPDTLAVPHPSSWTLTIGPGDQIAIGLACDSITGKYRIDGTTLRLENAVNGLLACGYSKSVPQTEIAAIQAIDRIISNLAQGEITFAAATGSAPAQQLGCLGDLHQALTAHPRSSIEYAEGPFTP